MCGWKPLPYTVSGTALQAEIPLVVFESEGVAPGYSKYWLPASS